MPTPVGPAVLATGSAVPPTVRRNDDPVFDYLRNHHASGSDLFAGYEERRVLTPDELLSDLMQTAGRRALDAAGVEAAEVDLLIGYASLSTWATPNDLSLVGRELGVRRDAMVLPVNGEFAIFNQGLVLADALLAAGRATTALVVVGADWSRRVDYRTAQAISAGDGAGAAVVRRTADPSRWRLTEAAADSYLADLGGMYLAADPTTPPIVPPTYGAAYFHLGAKGVDGFKNFATTGPPDLARDVLARHGVATGDVTLIAHQASSVLLDAWRQDLSPGGSVDTMRAYANMTSASIPVTLDVCADEITTDHVLLLALGPEPSCTVVLLSRDQAGASRSS